MASGRQVGKTAVERPRDVGQGIDLQDEPAADPICPDDVMQSCRRTEQNLVESEQQRTKVVRADALLSCGEFDLNV